MCRYFIYCGVTLIGNSISIRNNTMVAYLCPFLLYASATMVLTPQDKLGLVLHWGEFRFSATHQCYTIIWIANIYSIFCKMNFKIYFRRPQMFSFFGRNSKGGNSGNNLSHYVYHTAAALNINGSNSNISTDPMAWPRAGLVIVVGDSLYSSSR